MTSTRPNAAGVAITFVLCLGLFQAKSVALAMLCLATLLLAATLRLPAAITRFRLPVLIVFIYVVYVVVNLAIHGSIGDILSSEFFRYDGKLLPTLVIFVGAALFFDGDRRTSPLWTAVFGILICAAILLPAMLLFGDSKKGLLTGFFNSHNALAGSMGSLLLVVGLVQNRIKQVSQTLWLVTVVVGILSAYLFLMAGSRAFMLGLAAATAYIVLTTNRTFLTKALQSVAVLIALVIVVVFSPIAERVSYSYLKSDHNVLTRISYWQKAGQYAAESPVIGVGIGTFNDSSVVLERIAPGVSIRSRSAKFYGENHAHNIVLHLTAEQGLLGLLLLGWFWASLLRRDPRNYIQFRPHEEQDFALMKRLVRATFIYLLAASMLGNNLLTMSTSFIFYILAAAFVASSTRKSAQTNAPVPGYIISEGQFRPGLSSGSV